MSTARQTSVNNFWISKSFSMLLSLKKIYALKHENMVKQGISPWPPCCLNEKYRTWCCSGERYVRSITAELFAVEKPRLTVWQLNRTLNYCLLYLILIFRFYLVISKLPPPRYRNCASFATGMRARFLRNTARAFGRERKEELLAHPAIGFRRWLPE